MPPASPQTPVRPGMQGVLSTQCSHALTGPSDSWAETGQVECGVSSQVQGLCEGGVDTLQTWTDSSARNGGGAEREHAPLAPILFISVSVLGLLGPGHGFFS